MEDQFGSDFITISDEDGAEYELEVLSTLEYNGSTYLAVIPAGEGASNPWKKMASRSCVPLRMSRNSRPSMT